MSHDFAIKLVQVLIALLVPLGCWRLLAIYARRNPGILRPLLPKLGRLNLVVGAVAMFLYVMGIKERRFMKIAVLLTVISSVLGMMRAWVQRRVHPV